jgi:predicted ribosome quality control (RQC) complex YloA/Tae2 family protein
MSFDGFTIHALTDELSDLLTDRRISKIAQPEPEEILFTIKMPRGTARLLISANASLPLIYLTSENKTAPALAPNFCMVLRKHIANGRIKKIEQMGLERVIRFTIEHMDELGDTREKYLYVEIMGKHSNIIFTNEENVIIDSIKHISFQVSSVREVLPGKQYFIPAQEGRKDPLSETAEDFAATVMKKPLPIFKAIYSSYTGFSPLTANELCYRAGLDGDQSTASLTNIDRDRLSQEFASLMSDLKERNYRPAIIYDQGTEKPIEFTVLPLTIYEDKDQKAFDSISEMLETYYAERNVYTNMHQKSSDLRKIIQTLIQRNEKKLNLQEKQLKDTDKMDSYRLKGELVQAYAYSIPEGSKEAILDNWYDGSKMKVSLDPQKTPMENANHFFDKYQKLKRTREELSVFCKETEATLQHLLSIRANLDLCENEADIAEIRSEMEEAGFLHKKYGKKKVRQVKSRPLHFVTADGFHLYVGKNNHQNDDLTFHFANGNDLWFHAKKMPGSHVILKTEGREVPDHDYEIAAALAAYYSSGRDNDKLEVDYLRRKNVKKPNGSAPGFVVYYTNYSITVKPSLAEVTEVRE